MQVPLLDLKTQYAALKDQILPAISAVLDSQQLINGPAVKQFEDEVAKYSHTKSAIGVSSGTDALLCALMAMDIGPGDEVVTTPYTFFATAGSIARVGAKPVFVDIELDTFNIDATKIAGAITSKTKAIMPVHLFGQMADMEAIMDIARQKNLRVIEDAAQSIGCTYKGRQCGSIGTVGCFSFFPSKNLGGLGDGGMIVTQDPALGERMAIFRGHGSKPKYFHKWVGGNFRIDTIQAAYLSIKLKYLDGWSEQRRKNARLYDELLAGAKDVTRPAIRPHNVSIYNQYCIRVPKRDALMTHLKENGIGTEIYYPLCMHEQECFAYLGYKKGAFPNSERAAAESLALPIYPELREEQIRYVADTIKRYFA
jgi:dTDP-4-amino-4,6-dideoxygalactose transaminase